MICLFHPKTKKEVVIERNGDYVIDKYITRSLITEKIDGTYDLSFTMLNNADYKLLNLVCKGSIVKTNDEHGDEIFRIESVKKDKKYIEVYARQITIDETLSLWLEDVRPTNLNGQAALSYLVDNAVGETELIVSSDIAKNNTAYYVRKNMYEALACEDTAFLNRWGGEIKRRGYALYINSRIGMDKGFSIESRKNLLGFNIKEENTVITAIKPMGFDGITTDIVYSKHKDDYPRLYVKEIKWEDVKLKSEEEPDGYETLAEAQAELKKRAEKEFTENKIDLIQATYEIDFIELAKTEEYKNIKNVQSASIGDDVTVWIDTYGLELKARVTERQYSPTLDRRIKTTLSTRINTTVPPKPSDILQQIQQQLPPNKLPTLENYIDSMITSGFKNSYYISRPNEALWLDNPDINKAINVVRMNKNGLGFSQSGYYGKYVYGFTIDGKINADLITVGQLNGALIKAGTLTADKIEVSFKDDIKDQIQGEIQGDITDTILPSIKDEVTGEITNQVLKDYVTKSEFTVDKNGLTNKIEGVREEITTKVTESESNTDEKLKEVNKTITNLDTKFSTANGVIQQQVNGQSTTIQEIYKEVEGQGQQLVTTNKILSETKNSLTTDLEGIKANANRTDQVIKNINSNLSSVETRVYNAEQKITPKAITSTVRGSIEYKNDINGVSNRIEQVQSSLNVDLNGIRGSVTRVDNAIKNTNADMREVETRIYNAEQKITPTNIINQVNTAIRGGSQINSVSTVLDKNGFTVNNGAITVNNQQRRKVFWVDTTGQLCTDNIHIFGEERLGNLDIRGTGNKGIGIRSLNRGDRYIDFSTLQQGSSYEQDRVSGTFTRLMAQQGDFFIRPSENLYIDSVSKGKLKYIQLNTNKLQNTGNFENNGEVKCDKLRTDIILPRLKNGITFETEIYATHNITLSGALKTNLIHHKSGPSGNDKPVNFTSPINMNNKYILNAKGGFVGFSLYEPIPFSYNKENENIKEEYSVVKTKQNILELIGNTNIKEQEEYFIEFDKNIAYKNYVVLLTPIGENKSVGITRKEENGFYIKGDKCEVDYCIKFNMI